MGHYNYAYCDAMGSWFLNITVNFTYDGVDYVVSMADLWNDIFGDFSILAWTEGTDISLPSTW